MTETISKLGDFIIDCLKQADEMRAGGVSRDDIQRGLRVTVIDGARERGLITADRDLPYWLHKRCQVCLDSGWEPTTRLVRGEVVEAYKRCPCQGISNEAREDVREIASKVSSNWKQAGRR